MVGDDAYIVPFKMPEFKQFYERKAGALKIDKTILCVYRVEPLDRCDEGHRTLQIENNISKKRLLAYPFSDLQTVFFIWAVFYSPIFYSSLVYS